MYKVKPERFAKFANKVFKIENPDIEKTAILGIEAMEEFYKSIDMPTSISYFDISPTDAQIDEMADKATSQDTSTLGNFKKLKKADIKTILTMAR